MTTVADRNKQLAIEFFETLVNKRQPREAFDRFVGPEYIQHGVHAEDGIEGAMKALVPLMGNHPEIQMDIKRVLGDGDLVVIHHHLKLKPQDLGLAVVEIFRFENSRIVEHWDVMMPVPEKSHNNNTMF
jgi:predicted SnoaL-like aldol condensation-catalyzing enzyme